MRRQFALTFVRPSIYDGMGIGFLALMALTWTLVSLVTRPFPTRQAADLILQAHTPQGPQSGLEQLLAAWFSLVPVNNFFFFFFHQLHLFVALVGIWACARFMFGAQKALLVACLSAFIPLISVLGLGSLSAVLILAAGWTWVAFAMLIAVSGYWKTALPLLFTASFYASIANHGLVFLLPGFVLWVFVGGLYLSKYWHILLALPATAFVGWLSARVLMAGASPDPSAPLTSGQFPGSIALVFAGLILLCLGAMLLGLRFKLRHERWFANDITHRVFAVSLLWVSGFCALLSWNVRHDWYQLIWTNVQPVEALTILALLPLPLLMLFLATNADSLSAKGSPFLRSTGALMGFVLAALSANSFFPKAATPNLDPQIVQQVKAVLEAENRAHPFSILATTRPLGLELLSRQGLDFEYQRSTDLEALPNLENPTDIVGLCIGARVLCPNLSQVIDQRIVMKTFDLAGTPGGKTEAVQARILRAPIPQKGLPTLKLNTGPKRPLDLPPGLQLGPQLRLPIE